MNRLKPHELLNQDCRDLEWQRMLRWPLLLLALAGSFYALSDQGALAWIVAAVTVAAAAVAFWQGAAMKREIGFLEEEEE
jgi:hypothetical protein